MSVSNEFWRKGSLGHKLGTDERRYQVWCWRREDGLGPEEVAAKIQKVYDIKTSAAAVSTMLKEGGLVIRVKSAGLLADRQADALPEDIEETVRRRLRQQFYDAAFENLSKDELITFMRYELSEKMHEHEVNKTTKVLAQKDEAIRQKDVSLKQKDKALQQSERRVKLLEANAQEAKKLLTEATSKAGKGTTAETIRRIEEAARLL